MRHALLLLAVASLLASSQSVCAAEADDVRSHKPLRHNPPVSQRARTEGPAWFVDAKRGDDSHPGTEVQPWRTLRHAMGHLKAGDTLYLREGVYYENAYVALVGRADAPITIRAFPGEQAVLDGSIAEFFTQPATAWTPFAGGAKDEYRSAHRHPNLRTVAGSFGDSRIGLQTYEYDKDLRATSELIDWEDWDHQDTTDLKPLYCGPGVWYDRQTGYIHARLSHTNLPEPVQNYHGETDPRRVPLILAPFASVTLRLDGAKHVRLRDLVIRGGGYTTIELDHAQYIEFDNVTVWCGTYGLRASRTGPLKFVNSALHGNLAPWTFRADASKRDYPGRPHRNISRLNTHALLEIATGAESSVYATPQNDHWEFAYSEFTDSHDGLYLGGIKSRFHHNLVENFQDDGIYLSPMYPRYRLDKSVDEVHIYDNLFRSVLTALAFGGPEPTTTDVVYVYRNVFDFRQAALTGRPSVRDAIVRTNTGKPIGDHGSPPWAAMNIYHNTFVLAEQGRDAAMATTSASASGRPRRVFNNLFLHLARLPAFMPPNPDVDSVADGNLYWSPQAEAKQVTAFFTKFRASEGFARSKTLYPAGSTTHCQVADPKLLNFPAEGLAHSDLRLSPDSPAVGAGVVLPAEWPDPARPADGARPDVGALPKSATSPHYGRPSAAKEK